MGTWWSELVLVTECRKRSTSACVGELLWDPWVKCVGKKKGINMMISCMLSWRGARARASSSRWGLKPLCWPGHSSWSPGAHLWLAGGFQQTPENFHSSPQEDAIRWAESLSLPESQDFLNNRGSWHPRKDVSCRQGDRNGDAGSNCQHVVCRLQARRGQ